MRQPLRFTVGAAPWRTRADVRRNLLSYLRLNCGWLTVEYSVAIGGTMQGITCLRCRRDIESGDKSVAVYMFAQTVGVRPRQKLAANRVCFCPQCAVSLAMGVPPEGALNMAAWDMIRELVSAEPSLNQAAWESLRGIVGLLPSGKDERDSGRVRRAG